MLSGFIPLNKPPGITSQQAVARIRRLPGVKKAGHTGTLDPAAQGLLLVAINRATRLSEYFLRSDKGYRAEIFFGVATDTGDREGNEVARQDDFFLSTDAVAAVLKRFQGTITQVPPAASAVKIAGKRAYQLFRQGKKPNLPPRQIHIKSIVPVHLSALTPAAPLLTVDIVCSSGTYIRSLAADIGNALGVPAHLAALTRTRIADITLGQAATFADLEEDIAPWLLEMETAVASLPQLRLSGDQATRFVHGGQLRAPGFQGEVAVFWGTKLLGIALAQGEIIKPIKVLTQEKCQ